jgi:hypothetical protein
MRLDLPAQLAIETPEWIMRIGVRVAPDDLAARLQHLIDGCPGPTPRVTTTV